MGKASRGARVSACGRRSCANFGPACGRPLRARKVSGVKLRLLAVAAVAAALTLAAPAFAAPPGVDARAYLVANASTGEVLASRNADEQVPIASITKLMTVLVTLEHARLT